MKGGACTFGPDGNPIDGDTPCPGSKILEERNVITPYNPDTSVYFMIGHSCDMINDIRPVPENCVYVTKAMCGVVTFHDIGTTKFLQAFSNNSIILKKIMEKNTWVLYDQHILLIQMVLYKQLGQM